jgi:hypothetical protein
MNTILCNKIASTFSCCFLTIMEDMMDANVYFMKQDKCWNVFWFRDLVTSTLIQHTLLDQGPYVKTTWAIVQTFRLSTQP